MGVATVLSYHDYLELTSVFCLDYVFEIKRSQSGLHRWMKLAWALAAGPSGVCCLLLEMMLAPHRCRAASSALPPVLCNM